MSSVWWKICILQHESCVTRQQASFPAHVLASLGSHCQSAAFPVQMGSGDVFRLAQSHPKGLAVEPLVCSLGHFSCSLSVPLLPPLGEGRRPPPWPRCGRAGPSVGAAGSLAARPCPLCPVSPPPRCEGARVGLWSEGCAVPGHTQSQGGGCAPSRLFEAALGRVPWSRSGPVTRASCLGAQNSPAWGGPSGREVRQLP